MDSWTQGALSTAFGSAIALLAPGPTWYKLLVSIVLSCSVCYVYARYNKALFRRRSAWLRWSYRVLLGIAFLAGTSPFWTPPEWWQLGLTVSVYLAVMFAALYWSRTPEEPLARDARSLVDEYRDSGYNLPLMKRRYAGYLFDARGPIRPRTEDKEAGVWWAEVDCGASQHVDKYVRVIVELEEFPVRLWNLESVLARGRIESFDSFNVILGKSKLFT